MNISACVKETGRQLGKRGNDRLKLILGQEYTQNQVVDFLKTEENKPEFRVFVMLPSCLRRLKGVTVKGETSKEHSSAFGHVFSSVVDNKGKEFFFGMESYESMQRQITHQRVNVSYIFKGLLGHRIRGLISTKPCFFHVCRKIPITAEKAEKLKYLGNKKKIQLNRLNKANVDYQLLRDNCVSFVLDLAKKVGHTLKKEAKFNSPAGLVIEMRKKSPKGLFLEV